MKDINFELEYILLAHMKTKRQVDVPLSSSLKNILQEYIPIMGIQDDVLFPKLNGTKMSYDTLHQNLNNYFRHCTVNMRGVNTLEIHLLLCL